MRGGGVFTGRLQDEDVLLNLKLHVKQNIQVLEMEMHNRTPVSLFPPPPSKLSVLRATPGAGGNSHPCVFSVLSFPPHLRPCSRVARWCSLLEGRSSRKPRRPRAEFSAQLLASHQSTRYIFQDSASAVRGGFFKQPGLRTCLHRLRP